MKQLAAILLFLTALSCETVITVPVPDNAGVLTLNALFIDGEKPQLQLSESVNVLDNSPFPSVENATVSLYKNDVFLTELLHFGDGFYGLPDPYGPDAIKMEAGNTYRLEISVAGKSPLSAETYIPLPVVPVSLELGDEVSLEGQLHTEVILKFQDPIGVSDFYTVTLTYEGEYWGYGFPLCFRNIDTDFESPGDFLNGIDGLPFYCEEEYLRDDLFNGNLKTITMLVPSDYYYSGIGSDGVLRLFLGRPSEDYFLYRLSEQLQYSNDGNPFAQPTTINSNVTGGYGIFGSISKGTISLEL